MSQSIAYAVMSQRTEPSDSLDDFPTPPWAIRALLEHVIRYDFHKSMYCLEPACGAGHMAKVLKEYFENVISSDIHDYGYGKVQDFLQSYICCDWVITNPPFRLAQNFASNWIQITPYGRS
jgi:hypothetical protein